MLDTYYIICLPILFILHDTEEIITYHRWIIAHRKAFIQKFPRLRSMFNYMADFSTSSFIWAALEELLVLLLETFCIQRKEFIPFFVFPAETPETGVP